jgi:hypothetical protein
MAEFGLLQPDEYQKYYITNPVDFVGKSAWYVHCDSYNQYGPWFVLGFLQSKLKPEILTFRLCSYDEEFIPDMNTDPPFDIFCHSSPGHSLTQPVVEEIVTLLKTHGQNLKESPEYRANMFGRIPEMDWPKWHIKQSNSYEKRVLFYQTHDPLNLDNSSRDKTIITMSTANSSAGTAPKWVWSKKLPSIYVRITRFLERELDDPKFDPFSSWMGHINLDNQGVYEFAQLLEENWLDLASWRGRV